MIFNLTFNSEWIANGKWIEAKKFNFEKIANLLSPKPLTRIHPSESSELGEPNKFCRPSEQKAIAHDSGLFGGLAPQTVKA